VILGSYLPSVWRHSKGIYEQIMNIDPKIRLVTMCNINRKMMYSDYREGIENLLTSEESKKSESSCERMENTKQP
jgi:hypothetical protein